MRKIKNVYYFRLGPGSRSTCRKKKEPSSIKKIQKVKLKKDKKRSKRTELVKRSEGRRHFRHPVRVQQGNKSYLHKGTDHPNIIIEQNKVRISLGILELEYFFFVSGRNLRRKGIRPQHARTELLHHSSHSNLVMTCLSRLQKNFREFFCQVHFQFF